MEEIIKSAKKLLELIYSKGFTWKSEAKKIGHLKKRINQGHLPENSTYEDYERVIWDLFLENDNETYLYYKHEDDYFVFANPSSNWIVIVGLDAVLETAFIVDLYGYDEYLSEEEGYKYLGLIWEVLSW